MSIEEFPLLVLERILTFLKFSDLNSLSSVSTLFNKLVKDEVREEITFPLRQTEFSQRERKKPILRLSVIVPFDPLNLNQTNENLVGYVNQLEDFNTSKVGELRVLLDSQTDFVWPDVFRIYYHFLLLMILDSKIQLCDIKTLEVQVDFLCDQCRGLLEKIPSILPFSGLTKLKVRCISYNDIPTVGLYVHFFKMIFKFASLEWFEIRDIPDLIFPELKLWFLPDNIYFSQLREFTIFTHHTASRLLFRFTGPPLSPAPVPAIALLS